MKKVRKFVSIIVTLCFLLTLVPAGAFAAPTETDTPFNDVQSSDWFHEPVQYVYDEGLMAGTGDRIFSPQQTTTRGMIVTILHRMAGSPNAAAQDFTDVDADAWYAEAINWSIESGVGAGYGGGLFGPDDAITREQMASFLYRYAELEGYDVSAVGELEDFADASAVSDWAEDVMSWAVGADLFAGRDNNQLAPQGLTTRAEAATILMRYCENIVEEEPDEPSDEPGVDDPSGESPEEPDTPVVEPDNPSDDNPSTDPTPEEPDEPSTEPDPTPEGPSDDGEPGKISYTAPTTDNIETGMLTYEEKTYEAEYVNNQLVVEAKDGVTRAAVEKLISAYDAKIVGEIETIGMYQIQFASEKTLDELNEIITTLKADANVEDAYLNTVVELSDDGTQFYPTDYWNIAEDGVGAWDELYPGGNNWGPEAINAPSAWQLLIDKYGSLEKIPSVNVGVIDGYIDMTHSDLDVTRVFDYTDGYRILEKGSEESKELAAKVYAASTWDEFKTLTHGTHVMGTIGATFNNGGVNGIAPNAELYGASVGQNIKKTYTCFGNATALSNLIEASKCKVINFSQTNKNAGETWTYMQGLRVSGVLKDYLEKGYDDFLIVTSAGNETDREAGDASFFNSIYDEQAKSHILVVGNAADASAGIYYKYEAQSGGSRVDVMAPGAQIYSTVPSNPNTFYSDKEKKNVVYSALDQHMKTSGTSMAAPHVAGVAALVWAANPNLDGAQVKDYIVESANIPVLDEKQVFSCGKNMVNAAYAVSMALGKEYVVSGKCGDNVTWSLDIDGNLSINGTGEMKNNEGRIYAPWYRYRNEITSIEISDGITSVFDSAFADCKRIHKVEIPKSVVSIGYQAFGYQDNEVDSEYIIYGYRGTEEQPSASETYAEENGIEFYDLESSGELIPPEDPDEEDDPETGDVAFAGGNGTKEDPYQIATPEQLAYLSEQVEGGELYNNNYFELTSNINLSKYDQWKPIGSNEKRFAGTFDGKGYKISNMTIVPDLGGIGVGLFGYIGNATISNIVLDNVNIQIQQTAQAVGGIAGGAYQADISNCTVSGKISVGQATASTDVMCGGIVGILGGDSNVKNCTNSADIDCGAHSAIGGIVGAAIANLNSVIRVSECKNTGNVQGGENVGDIVGLKQSTSGSQIIIS